MKVQDTSFCSLHQSEALQHQDNIAKMIDNDIVLEALGVICNAKITSVQQKQGEVGIGSGLLEAFKNLFFTAPATQLPVTQLISTVVDGDQTW